MTLDEKFSDVRLVIFDCDGTLYRQSDERFTEMPFWHEVKTRSTQLLQDSLQLSLKDAEQRFEQYFRDFKGEISEAFEREVGMPRETYFQQTWGAITPSDYTLEGRIEPVTLDALEQSGVRIALLTNAPAPWTKNVLAHLGIERHFNGNVWTGEGAIRKPLPESYLQVLERFNVAPHEVLMVGDDEKLDIIVPNTLGIRTARINPYNHETAASYAIQDVNELMALRGSR